jgi:hypothetical protein
LAPFFARLASKFEKSTSMTLTNFFWKNRKNAKFHADFKSAEKVLKNTKKSYKQNKFDKDE